MCGVVGAYVLEVCSGWGCEEVEGGQRETFD